VGRENGALAERTFQRGSLILREGDVGSEAYLIKSGRVEIFRAVDGRKLTINQVGPGSLIGEMALIDDSTRMACAAAMETTVCVVVSRDAFVEAFNQAPPLVQYLLQTQVNTLRELSGVYREGFAEREVLPGAVLVSHRTHSEILQRRIYEAGRNIIRQGEEGNSAFLVQSGDVELWRTTLKGEREALRRCGPGAVFGEMSLFDKRPRSATATAVETTVCEVISDATFEKLVNSTSPLMRLLLRSYVRYIQSQSKDELEM
jgi:CRP-like cAMP-binding protein